MLIRVCIPLETRKESLSSEAWLRRQSWSKTCYILCYNYGIKCTQWLQMKILTWEGSNDANFMLDRYLYLYSIRVRIRRVYYTE